ncbi:putative reverse transcriptase domain-containing protein [Tanacetum coccineum]
MGITLSGSQGLSSPQANGCVVPTGRYVVPTGRVIATDSVIVATSGYVVPAAYDICPGRVKVETYKHPGLANSVPPVHRMTTRISIRDEPSISLPPRQARDYTTRPIRGRRADYGFVGTMDIEIRRQRAEEVGYRIRDVWVDLREAVEKTQIYQSVGTLVDDSQYHYETTRLLDQEALVSREAWGCSIEVSYMTHSEIMELRSVVMGQQAVISQLQAADRKSQMAEFQRQLGPAKGPTQPDAPGEAGLLFRYYVFLVIIKKMAPKRRTTRTLIGEGCYCCTSSSGDAPGMTIDSPYSRTCGVVGLTKWFEKMEYCVKHKQCTVSLPSPKFAYVYRPTFPRTGTNLRSDVSERNRQIKKYVGGLPDMIHGSVMETKPKTMQDAIEFATELMDKKINTWAERQANNKRKSDDTARNNQNQQPNKRQNTGKAYAAGNGNKRPYKGPRPLKDCPKLKNNNRGNRVGNAKAQAKVYAVGNAGANPDNNVVTGMFLLNNRYASILFDTGADRSFVSTAFSSRIVITPTALDHDYNVELADGRIVGLNTIIRGCTLNFLNHPFNIDLMPVEQGSFDMIIGMDWLAKYHVVIVCAKKIVRVPFGDEILIIRGDGSSNKHVRNTKSVGHFQVVTGLSS